MKPNLIIVQPPHIDSDSTIDHFCETMCDTHYVYLIRKITKFQDDSAAGVRFLNFSLDRLPGFGEVETVIVIDSAEIAARFKEAYPAAHHALWDIESHGAFPVPLLPSRSQTIIQGEFGQGSDQASEPQFAQAI